MRLLIFLLLCSATLTAQDIPADDEGKRTQISGTLRNVTAPAVGITFFSDLISLAEELYQVPIDSTDRFSMRFRLHEPTQIRLNYNGQSIRLYIEPGDDIQLRFDGNALASTLVIKGIGALHNDFLQQEHRLFNQWNEEQLLYEMADRTPLDFRGYMDAQRRQRWSFFRQFPGRSKFSDDFRYFMAADIDYGWGYYLLRYRLEHYVAQGLKEAPMPDPYYHFLNDLVISNDRAMNNPNYLYFLDQYLRFRQECDTLPIVEPVNILVDVPSLFMMSKPEQPPIVTELKKGDRLRFLNEKSDFKSKIMIREALHEDHWYRVKTGDGHEGWVIGVGLLFEPTPTPDTTGTGPPKLKSQSQYARELLKGKALYYTLANDLYWRAHTHATRRHGAGGGVICFAQPDQSLRSDIAAHASHGPDEGES